MHLLDDPRFGPDAQTPAQRVRVLARMQVTFPALQTDVSARVQQLHARYIAGELSWKEVQHGAR